MSKKNDIYDLLIMASNYYSAIDCRDESSPDAILWSLEIDAAIMLYNSGTLKDGSLIPIFSAHSLNLAAAGYPLQAQVYKNAAASLKSKQ